MNLRALVNGATSTINPNVGATLYISTGSTTVHFKQTPTYDQSPVTAQVQPLSSGDIRQLDALNIQGAQKAVYLNGAVHTIDRVKKLGGDLIVFPDGTLPEGNVWLTLASIEQWANWCKVAVVLQDDLPPPS
jgi:signal peptidase I